MVTHGNWAKQKKQVECCVTTLKTAAKETTVKPVLSGHPRGML